MVSNSVSATFWAALGLLLGLVSSDHPEVAILVAGAPSKTDTAVIRSLPTNSQLID